MADNVSLDLAGSRFERIAARAEESLCPLAIVDRTRRVFLQHCVRSEDFLGHLLEALVILTPEDLENGTFGYRDGSGTAARDGADLIQAEHLEFGISLREFLPHDRILAERLAIPAHLLRKQHQPVEGSPVENRDAGSKRCAF